MEATPLKATETKSELTLLVNESELINTKLSTYEVRKLDDQLWYVFGQYPKGTTILIASSPSEERANSFKNWLMDIMMQAMNQENTLQDLETYLAVSNSDDAVSQFELDYFKSYSDNEIIAELERRGYVLGSAWQIQDAQHALDTENEEEGTEHEMDEEDLRSTITVALEQASQDINDYIATIIREKIADRGLGELNYESSND